MEICTFVFRDLLGFDADKHKSKPGLLGQLAYYGGGIETQGSSTLHFHVCFRVEMWPQWLRNDGDAQTGRAESNSMDSETAHGDDSGMDLEPSADPKTVDEPQPQRPENTRKSESNKKRLFGATILR